MKKGYILFIAFVCLEATISRAQIGIGTTSPNPSSILDLESTSKGFLPPRVNSDGDIATPVEGLMIYDIGDNCINVYNNSTWVNLCDQGGGSGGSGNNTSNFLAESTSRLKRSRSHISSTPSPSYYGAFDISNDASTLVIGSEREANNTGLNYGAFYFYNKNTSTGLFDFDTIIPTPANTSYPNFQQQYIGTAVTVSGDGTTAAIGGRYNQSYAIYHGLINVYEKTNGNWNYVTSLDNGNTTSISRMVMSNMNDAGNRIFAGNSVLDNTVQIFDKVSSTNWNRTTITKPSTSLAFGQKLDITGDGNKLVVLGGTATHGLVFVYEYTNGSGWGCSKLHLKWFTRTSFIFKYWS